MIGLNVDRWGRAHVPTVKSGGVQLVRLALCQWDGEPLDVVEAVGRWYRAGVQVLGGFWQESLAGPDGKQRSVDQALDDYGRLVGPLLWGIQPGNEYSNPIKAGSASWSMTAAAQSELIRNAAARFRPYRADLTVVSGSVGTGQPSDVSALDLSSADMVGVNLYNASVGGVPPGSFGPAENLALFTQAAGGRPLVIAEWSTTNDQDAPAYIDRSARYYRSLPYVAADCYFRYSDDGKLGANMDGQNFGLWNTPPLASSQEETSRWAPFKQVNQEVPYVPTPPPAPPAPAAAPDNAVIAYSQLWSSLVPADYHHDFGIETAWRANWRDWGWPLAPAESPFTYVSGTASGRVFSKVGIVVWDAALGAVVLGWP